MTTVVGIDLAWQTEKNPSAIAVATLANQHLVLVELVPVITGVNAIAQQVLAVNCAGVAIDAPLIINNQTGLRDCERALNRVYASKRAGCHPSNLSLYPNAGSVTLSECLRTAGYAHRGQSRFQIECYPHPSMIECFGLPARLLYKKGSVQAKRDGQVLLAQHLLALSLSSLLSLHIPPELAQCLDADYIQALKGRAIKTNEDALDAIFCAYIAGLYAVGAKGRCFGDTADGYIWVPDGQR